MVARQMSNPIVVIVGETASGKSALAMELAERFNGEIITADSRTVYKGMDIGTAKPSPEDRQHIRHHGLDLVEPSEQFTAADFKAYADAALIDISMRGKLPIIVGGTGLYVDAVLYDFQFNPLAAPAERARLQKLSIQELQAELREKSIALPANERNPRHLIRAIETGGRTADRGQLRPNTLILGLSPDREELSARIGQRVEHMIALGLEQEVLGLSRQYGWEVPAMLTIGYREWKDYFNGLQTLPETERQIIKNTMSYAKRQRTWFKRNNSVQWLANRGNLPTSVDLVTTLLNN
ncbi:MAG: putative tRNA dimethylallyltransferase [Candidatus Saccharibacteria bacterium]|nr:putative tRNA dimethylallyltransferase [Candidatus Saccharibacteria bacterium]